MTPGVRFTRAGFVAGFRQSIVIAPTVALYGVAFGVLAGASSLSALQSLLFSAWVNAGGAQMASLQAWSEPVPVLAVVLTTWAMNSRYLLLGAALRPVMGDLPARQVYPSLFVLGDGNWALTMREFAAGRHDGAFLAGSGVAMWLCWVLATVAGHAFGRTVGNPERYGLDFMLMAFFAAMTVSFYRRPASLVPFVFGAVVAIVVQRQLAGPWYLLIGAAVGSLLVLMLPEPRDAG
ncbi:MAG TPA: AzlC family ABC transporter permease [Burkholderiaceae bacterium]|nr:AzlC family ABC transporter permease [Burkholderiaceae bacterium]